MLTKYLLVDTIEDLKKAEYFMKMIIYLKAEGIEWF